MKRKKILFIILLLLVPGMLLLYMLIAEKPTGFINSCLHPLGIVFPFVIIFSIINYIILKKDKEISSGIKVLLVSISIPLLILWCILGGIGLFDIIYPGFSVGM